MSVIGPRPQLVRDLVFMSKEERKRHTVKPGLSYMFSKVAWDNLIASIMPNIY